MFTPTTKKNDGSVTGDANTNTETSTKMIGTLALVGTPSSGTPSSGTPSTSTWSSPAMTLSSPEEEPSAKKQRTDPEVQIVSELPPVKPHELSDATMANVVVSAEPVNSIRKKPKGPHDYTKLVSIKAIPIVDINQDSLRKFGQANLIIGYRKAKKKVLADSIAEEKVNPRVIKVAEKKKKAFPVNRKR